MNFFEEYEHMDVFYINMDRLKRRPSEALANEIGRTVTFDYSNRENIADDEKEVVC